MRTSAPLLAALMLFGCCLRPGTALADEAASPPQCHDLAARYFARDHGAGIERNDYVDPDTRKTLYDETRSTFRDYYRAPRKQCFVVISIENTTRLDAARNRAVWVIAIELNANRSAGLFHQTNDSADICFVGDRDCRSRAEWDSLLQPYLHD